MPLRGSTVELVAFFLGFFFSSVGAGARACKAPAVKTAAVVPGAGALAPLVPAEGAAPLAAPVEVAVVACGDEAVAVAEAAAPAAFEAMARGLRPPLADGGAGRAPLGAEVLVGAEAVVARGGGGGGGDVEGVTRGCCRGKGGDAEAEFAAPLALSSAATRRAAGSFFFSLSSPCPWVAVAAPDAAAALALALAAANFFFFFFSFSLAITTETESINVLAVILLATLAVSSLSPALFGS